MHNEEEVRGTDNPWAFQRGVVWSCFQDYWIMKWLYNKHDELWPQSMAGRGNRQHIHGMHGFHEACIAYGLYE